MKTEKFKTDSRWLEVKKKLSQAKKIIDLGCGNNPATGASAGVDLYVQPRERIDGDGPEIDTKTLEKKGIRFINQRVDAKLPFKDKEFDFAYSHHVFEHLEDPGTACEEMMRIAQSGAIITPSYFAELIFGRPYHRWLIMDREKTLYFFRKRPFENLPFGSAPRLGKDAKTWMLEKDTNPFDMLLNDEGWYQGQEGQMPKLSDLIRQYWYSHSPLLEVVFLWDNEFQWKIID